MQIQRIQNSPSFTNGIYFSRASNICFDKSADFLNPKGIVKTSENGYKYIEDVAISKTIQKKLSENDFIKNLGEKFDTFVWFRQIKPDTKIGNGHIAKVKIWWADPSKEAAQTRDIIGVSRNSAREALNNMFLKLE